MDQEFEEELTGQYIMFQAQCLEAMERKEI